MSLIRQVQQEKRCNGYILKKVCDIATELYLSMLVDRGSSQITIIASTEGGMDIVAVADTPERILTISIDPATGLKPHHIRSVANALKLTGITSKQALDFCLVSIRRFTQLDASLVEINPLVVTGSGDLLALMPKWDSMIMHCFVRKMCWRFVTSARKMSVRSKRLNLN